MDGDAVLKSLSVDDKDNNEEDGDNPSLMDDTSVVVPWLLSVDVVDNNEDDDIVLSIACGTPIFVMCSSCGMTYNKNLP